MTKTRLIADTEQMRVGAAIRELRKEARWTLADLAETTAIPVATLSRIERGVSGGSFDKISRIARAFGKSFDEITTLTSHRAPALVLNITRDGTGRSFANNRYDYEVLAADVTRKAFVPLVMTINARSRPGPYDWTSHPGEELIYVLTGRVKLFTAAHAPVELARGDSAYIDSGMSHAFATVTANGSPSKILAICTSDAGTAIGQSHS
ncbi:MAG: XRE family transcriptional regulator [Pseudomonadota bacterium]